MLARPYPLINRSDYEALPESNKVHQLIQGELVVSPSALPAHQRTVLALIKEIAIYLEKNPVGELFVAPLDVHLDEINIYQPDLFFIQSSRLHIVKDSVTGVPDLVIEVLSKGTERYDRGTKRKIFAKAELPELWLVDPVKRNIERWDLLKNADTATRIFAENERMESMVLSGLQFEVGKIFPNP